jgi:glycosyltransferase involved in cell wall biosynthesis
VPPRDPAAFAAACVTFLSAAELRARIGRRGRERALAEYTLDRCLSAYRARYRAMVRAPEPEPVLVAV